VRRLVAEAIGTFALVFAGCGAIVVNAERAGVLGATGVAAVFGLVIMVMIYALGHLSGAHFNPAVTLGFAAARRFPVREVPGYIAAQAAGATLGALLLRLAWEGTPADLGATVPSIGTGAAFTYELVMTAMLMFVVMAVATDARAVGSMAGLAVGGTVALDALFGGPLTGASMNPARSFGPALVASQWSQFWIYLAAPVAGALIAVVLYEVVRHEPRPESLSQ
jgi:aquaporin NIP